METNNNDTSDVDALKALADGVDFDEDPISPSASDSSLSQDETDDFLLAAAQGRPAEVEKIETVGSETQEQLANVELQVEREKRSAQGKAVAQIQHAARALHFRKMALPFLLAMAVILVFVAFATMHIASGAEPEQLKSNPLMANSGIFAGICFTMAAIMAAGGVFFLYEMKKLKAFIAEHS